MGHCRPDHILGGILYLLWRILPDENSDRNTMSGVRDDESCDFDAYRTFHRVFRDASHGITLDPAWSVLFYLQIFIGSKTKGSSGDSNCIMYIDDSTVHLSDGAYVSEPSSNGLYFHADW